MNERIRLEVAAINYFGIIESQKEHRELTHDEAGMRFVQEGYAEKYANIYHEGITRRELKDKLFGYDDNRKVYKH